MVAGHPVAVQAPARATPSTGVAVAGRRAAWPGRRRERGLRLLDHRRRERPRRPGAREQVLQLGAHRVGQLGARHVDLLAGPRDGDRQVVRRAVAAAHGGAVEDPLRRAVNDRRERLVHDRPVVPDVHVDDRRGAEPGIARRGPPGRRRGPARGAGRAPRRRRAGVAPSASATPPGPASATARAGDHPASPRAAGSRRAAGSTSAREADARPADRRAARRAQEPRWKTNAASAAETRSLRSLQVGSTMRSQNRRTAPGDWPRSASQSAKLTPVDGVPRALRHRGEGGQGAQGRGLLAGDRCG